MSSSCLCVAEFPRGQRLLLLEHVLVGGRDGTAIRRSRDSGHHPGHRRRVVSGDGARCLGPQSAASSPQLHHRPRR